MRYYSGTNIQGAVLWWWGDWLNYGKGHYPDRYKAAIEHIEQSGYDYQTLKNAASIAGKFEPYRRRYELAWKHYQEVAALDPPDQDGLLNEAAAAAANVWTIKGLRMVQVPD